MINDHAMEDKTFELYFRTRNLLMKVRTWWLSSFCPEKIEKWMCQNSAEGAMTYFFSESDEHHAMPTTDKFSQKEICSENLSSNARRLGWEEQPGWTHSLPRAASHTVVYQSDGNCWCWLRSNWTPSRPTESSVLHALHSTDSDLVRGKITQMSHYTILCHSLDIFKGNSLALWDKLTNTRLFPRYVKALFRSCLFGELKFSMQQNQNNEQRIPH